jgi:hypothetical protein
MTRQIEAWKFLYIVSESDTQIFYGPWTIFMCPLDAGQLFQWAIWVFYASMAQLNVIPTKVT